MEDDIGKESGIIEESNRLFEWMNEKTNEIREVASDSVLRLKKGDKNVSKVNTFCD